MSCYALVVQAHRAAWHRHSDPPNRGGAGLLGSRGSPLGGGLEERGGGGGKGAPPRLYLDSFRSTGPGGRYVSPLRGVGGVWGTPVHVPAGPLMRLSCTSMPVRARSCLSMLPHARSYPAHPAERRGNTRGRSVYLGDGRPKCRAGVLPRCGVRWGSSSAPASVFSALKKGEMRTMHKPL